MNNKSKTSLQDEYDESFYNDQIQGSLRSANYYVSYLKKFWLPSAVVDMGCGRGAWLAAFASAGSKQVVGYDGPWNKKELMIDQSIEFNSAILHELIIDPSAEKFDLAMSLEVAEHLDAKYAEGFVNNLTKLSDTVLFGAAFTEQGGTHHINEKPHTYWYEMFSERGFQVFDLFRPEFWGNNEIEFWYVQNTFLYVREGTAVDVLLRNAGFAPIKNPQFLNCVHPVLYNNKIQEIYRLSNSLQREKRPKQALKNLMHSITPRD